MNDRPTRAPLTRRRGRRALLGAGIVVVVAGGGAVGAALWGSFIRSEQAAPSGPAIPVPLNAVATQPTDRQLWPTLAARLAEREPAVLLAPEVVGLEDVARSLAAGAPAGLLAVPDSRVTQLAATGGLAATADLLRGKNAPTRDEFVHRLFGALSLEGVLYGLPWRWRGTTLLLDSAAWQRAELELPPDHWRDDRWSLPAMEAAITRFQELATANAPGPPPFRGGTRWSDWLPWLWLNDAALWRHGATATALTEPAAVAALQSYAEWRRAPQASTGDSGAIVMVEPTWRTMGQALTAGHAARPLPRGVWRTTLLRSDALLLTGAAAQPAAARRALVALATDAGQEDRSRGRGRLSRVASYTGGADAVGAMAGDAEPGTGAADLYRDGDLWRGTTLSEPLAGGRTCAQPRAGTGIGRSRTGGCGGTVGGRRTGARSWRHHAGRRGAAGPNPRPLPSREGES